MEARSANLRRILALASGVLIAGVAGWWGCRTLQTATSPGASRDRAFEVGTAPAPPDNPKELGWVHWRRNYDEAAAEAQASGKPLFLLFQEVPGCATCVGFGETVLSHPLLIEAIESDFVPVAIHNNKGGHDGEVLERFDEPSWNNPVVRFVDAGGADLIDRADGVWSTHGIARRMVRALEASGRPVPDYLRWTVAETAPSAERATFAMGCYWSGEACLGDLDGVVETNAGWLGGREVVEVTFDPDVVSRDALARLAAERGCGEVVARAKSARPAGDSDRKYHLQRSRWRYVPLTPLQATKVNAALRHAGDVEALVSPRQLALYHQLAAADADSLAGLERPETLHELADYDRRLRARLQ